MASMVAVGGGRSEEKRVRRVAARGFDDGEASRGRQRRRNGGDESRSRESFSSLLPVENGSYCPQTAAEARAATGSGPPRTNQRREAVVTSLPPRPEPPAWRLGS